MVLRWRDQAGVIVDEFGRGTAMSLDQLVRQGRLNGLSIFEPALRGPFVRRFRGLPGYVQSYFWPDRELGEVGPEGLPNEDLADLTFNDDTFDLILTSDVMEHLPEIEAAFSEINRVLKPGGRHVFTIPTDFPFPNKTEKRVEIRDGEEIRIKEARYHNAGDGTPCLVYTDYGADVVDMIDNFGSHTSIVRRSGAVTPCHTNATFVTRKLAGSGGRRPPAVPVLECPVCKGNEFEDFNGRANARCSKCRCVERNRLTWLVLEAMEAFQPDKRVLHIAPEGGLGRRFHALSGDGYHARDLDSDRYASKVIQVKSLDLCTDLPGIPDNSYDLILHSHVLEHLACDVETVLREFDRILAFGGQHFFSVPIRGLKTDEDYSGTLSEGARRARFGQEDHFRIFGADSLIEMLTRAWGPEAQVIEPINILSEEALRKAVIPASAWKGISGHSIFHYSKPALTG